MAQDPETPWHLHSLLIILRTAILPASLLCRLAMDAESVPDSAESEKKSEKCTVRLGLKFKDDYHSVEITEIYSHTFLTKIS